MSYSVHNFQTGDVLLASQLNEMDTQIALNEEAASSVVSSDVLADDYSATKTYAVGDYCFYNGNLYRCTTAITAAEGWNAEHWTEAELANDVTDLNQQISDVKSATNNLQDAVNNLYHAADVTALGAGNNYVVYGITNGHKYRITATSASTISCATVDENNNTIQSLNAITPGTNVVSEFTATADAPKVLFYFRAEGTATIQDLSAVVQGIKDKLDDSIETVTLTDAVERRPADNHIIVMRDQGTLTGSTTAPSLVGTKTYSYLGLLAKNKTNGVFFAKITVKNIGESNATNVKTYVAYNNSPTASATSSTFGTDISDGFVLNAGESKTIYHRFSSEYPASTYTAIAFGVLFGTANVTLSVSGVISDITNYTYLSDSELSDIMDNAELTGYSLNLDAHNSAKLEEKTLDEVVALAKQTNNNYSLIAYGDSLTRGSGGSGAPYRYLDICKTALGAKNDLPLGYGGSGSKAIAFTAGALSAFVPPNVNSFSLKYSDFSSDVYIANTQLNGKIVIIGGNEYTISQTGNTSFALPGSYTPSDCYEEVIVKDSRYTADIYIIFAGTNDHGMQWDILNAMITKLPHNQYVIMGLTKLGTDTSATDEKKAEELYGSHYFNTRMQIIGNAFQVLGQTPTPEDTIAMENGLMPPSLLTDETHFNDSGYEAIGKLLAKHIKALGYKYQTA